MRRNKTIIGRLKTIGCRFDAIIEACQGEESLYTAVNGSEVTADGCISPPLELTTTYYHNGVNEVPELGDTIWVDAAGTIPLQTSLLSGTGGEVYMEGESGEVGAAFIRTDANGVSILWTCR